MHILSLIAISFLFLSACESNTDLNKKPLSQIAAFISNNCGTCHGLGLTESTSAPNLIQVRKSWLTAYPDRQGFVDQMSSFLMQPEISKSQMPKAVESYGLMPKMGYSPTQAKEIANWLFGHEPGESTSHTEPTETDPLEQGRSIAQATKAALGKQLMTKLKESGPAGAIEFCQLKALPITDSVSISKGAQVLRISDKPRNPKNTCTEEELGFLKQWKTDLASGNEPQAFLIDKGNHTLGYYPIFTEEKCLACHGEPQKEVKKILEKRYPLDLALGYGVGQIRGAFRVRMPK